MSAKDDVNYYKIRGFYMLTISNYLLHLKMCDVDCAKRLHARRRYNLPSDVHDVCAFVLLIKLRT